LKHMTCANVMIRSKCMQGANFTLAHLPRATKIGWGKHYCLLVCPMGKRILIKLYSFYKTLLHNTYINKDIKCYYTA